MTRRVCAVGDTVTVRADFTKLAPAVRTCRIIGVLPADHGETQYRVRFDGENFERRIVASDVETTEAASHIEEGPSRIAKGEPWLKPSRIRIGR